MKKRTVDLTISQLINDLNNGMTWLKKEDEGYGSIQEKYGAKDLEILTIKKHPKLAGLEPSITEFRIIDDLKEESSSNVSSTSGTTKESKSTGADPKTSQLVVDLETPAAEMASTSSEADFDSFDQL